MKLEIKSKRTNTKGVICPVYYTLHTLKVTEANILDFINLSKAFISSDINTCAFEEIISEYNVMTFPSIKNIKEDSFDIEIEDYDDDLLEVITSLLTNQLKINIDSIEM